MKTIPIQSVQPGRVTRYQPQEHFPHGPRKLEPDDEQLEREAAKQSARTSTSTARPSNRTRPLASASSSRRRRSLVVSDRKVRSADVGVSGIYEVISEADLAFSPDSHAEAVTVFQVGCPFRFSLANEVG